MKTPLQFLTEEGRTRAKNAARRLKAYLAVTLFAAAAGAYGIHRYWVRGNLTPLQRVYIKQYLRSALKSYLPGTHSTYLTLIRTVTDPRTSKDTVLVVRDDEIEPVYDDDGDIRRDQQRYPLLLLKPGVEHKEYRWDPTTNRDAVMYLWYHDGFYEGQSIPQIWRPAWLGALLIVLCGTGGLLTLDVVAQRLYLRGEAIRGTRELAPKQYAREHRKEGGYGIKVYAQRRGK